MKPPDFSLRQLQVCGIAICRFVEFPQKPPNVAYVSRPSLSAATSFAGKITRAVQLFERDRQCVAFTPQVDSCGTLPTILRDAVDLRDGSPRGGPSRQDNADSHDYQPYRPTCCRSFAVSAKSVPAPACGFGGRKTGQLVRSLLDGSLDAALVALEEGSETWKSAKSLQKIPLFGCFAQQCARSAGKACQNSRTARPRRALYSMRAIVYADEALPLSFPSKSSWREISRRESLSTMVRWWPFRARRNASA